MTHIRALIFDLDGVIANTEEFHYQAWQRLADEENIPFSRADNEHLRGLTRDASLRRLLNGRELDLPTFDAWMQRKDSYFKAQMASLRPGDALPGVEALIHEAKQVGLALGVASASRNARPVLEKIGLLGEFQVIGDGYTVDNSKPAPDIFLWVAGGLAVPPRQCVVFEDSQAGVQAALTGGFQVIGVGDGLVRAAHRRVERLDDLTLAEVLEITVARA